VSTQSERIRAALVRSDTTRQPGEQPAPEPTEETNTIRPTIAVSEENLAALLGSGAAAKELPRTTERSGPRLVKAAAAPARVERSEPVEITLPLLGASEDNRAAVVRPKIALTEPPVNQPAEPAPAALPPAAVSGEKPQSRARLTLMAAGAVLALAAISGFLARDRWLSTAKPSRQAGSVPLQVAAEPQGNGLINVRWNPQSPPVIDAREGRLVITERDQQPRIVTLGPEQLRIGHLYYQSTAERIEFGLEVVDRLGAVARESAFAVSPAPIATPQGQAPPVAGQSLTAKAPGTPNSIPNGTPNIDPAAPVVKPEDTQVAAAPQPSRPAPRAFTMPQSAPRNTEPSRVTLPEPEPPAPVATGFAPPAIGLPTTLGGLPAPPVKQAPAPPKQVRVGGAIQAANLVKRVTPVYPPVAKAARIQGLVRFTAIIAKNGTIQNLQLVSGPPVLVQAATDAVRQWVYRPTLLNGEPVEVITQIDVNFDLSQ
jgi:outer membrane biosynthesis protein TonB